MDSALAMTLPNFAAAAADRPAKLRRMDKHINSSDSDVSDVNANNSIIRGEDMPTSSSVANMCAADTVETRAASVTTSETELLPQLQQPSSKSIANGECPASEEMQQSECDHGQHQARGPEEGLTLDDLDGQPDPDHDSDEDSFSPSPGSTSDVPNGVPCHIRTQTMVTVIINNDKQAKFFYRNSWTGSLTVRHPNTHYWG